MEETPERNKNVNDDTKSNRSNNTNPRSRSKSLNTSHTSIHTNQPQDQQPKTLRKTISNTSNLIHSNVLASMKNLQPLKRKSTVNIMNKSIEEIQEQNIDDLDIPFDSYKEIFQMVWTIVYQGLLGAVVFLL